MLNEKVVVVTGFGPFGEHSVNSSWQCAKELKQLNFEALNVSLIIKELPVAYDEVLKLVPELWQTYKPDILIHLGVHNENNIKIECCARKEGYLREDIFKKKPCSGKCPVGCFDVISTKIDVQKLMKTINTAEECPVCTSESAGNYLCEFTYYLSLNENQSRCLFIHVPPYDEKLITNVAHSVKGIIECLLKFS